MAEIMVEEWCDIKLEFPDESKLAAMKRMLFPSNDGDIRDWVRLKFDPECNQLEIEMVFRDDNDDGVGSLKMYVTTNYLVAGMLHAISTPIVKHMMKEG